MIRTDIMTEIRDALAMLDADEAPEARDYLGGLLLDGGPEPDPYDVACDLLTLDGPAPLPATLRGLIEELLEVSFYEDGNADAMNDLGAQYYDGARGFDRDYAGAVECYERAAEKGSRQAWENLGYCHYYGKGVPVDYDKSFHYFAPGAFEGNIVSLYKIGDMYRDGLGVEKDPAEAFRIYSRCLDTMTDEAAPRCAGPVYLRMGRALLSGDGANEDPKGALICFQRAETFLYDMVAGGGASYADSLRAAIDGQAKARAKLAAALSGM